MNDDILNLFLDSQAAVSGDYFEDEEPDEILLEFTKRNVVTLLERVFNININELDKFTDSLIDITDTKKLYEILNILLETYRTTYDLKHSVLYIAEADK